MKLFVVLFVSFLCFVPTESLGPELHWPCPRDPGGSAASTVAPVRSYLRNNYATLKTLNPKFPFLVRAAEDKPYIVATYGMGHTETRDLDGLDEAAVERTFEELVALGEKHPRSWPAADDLPPDIVAAPGAEWGADAAEKAA